MKLDRNINKDGTGKYALIKLREGKIKFPDNNTAVVTPYSAIDLGSDESEFFVIRLKDKHAAPALAAYALSAYQDDPEYGMEILNMAKRAAEHPSQKKPD